jgi:hypothetical protein
MSSPKPLHVFRQGVASLRESAISTTNFSGLRDPPVFSPVVPINPSSTNNAKNSNAKLQGKANRSLFEGAGSLNHFSDRRKDAVNGDERPKGGPERQRGVRCKAPNNS